MLNGIDKGGAFLAKLFAKLCTYGVAYAVIYIAIQTALPGLRNGFIYNVAMIIVMAAPELMIAGLAVEAMDKFKENKALGSFMFIVAALFLSIGILTMVDVFFWKFGDGTPGQQMLTLYRAIVVLVYSAVHGIVSKMNEQRSEKAQQITQANDRLLLQNQKEIAEVRTDVDKLVDTVDTLGKMYTKLAERVDTSVDTVDKAEFNQLAQTVKIMSTSVNQVNQNVLQITQNTQNLYGISDRPQRPQPQNEMYTTHVEEIQDTHASLPQRAETIEQNTSTDSVKALEMPVLEVPGVSPAQVEKALKAYLSGMDWREVPCNYTRVTKYVREAYEAYQATLSAAV